MNITLAATSAPLTTSSLPATRKRWLKISRKMKAARDFEALLLDARQLG